MTPEQKKTRIALYASPECCRDPNLRYYKSYFNVAWFVRAYSSVLFSEDQIVLTTEETKAAVLNAQDTVDEVVAHLWPQVTCDYWRVPTREDLKDLLVSVGSGFDAQVELAACVANRQIDRVLMFQDPDDVQPHLPEAHALIRNCAIADIGLNINAGATFWAEAQYQSDTRDLEMGFGNWRSGDEVENLHKLINPLEQRIAFIAHDRMKDKMARLVYHFRNQLSSPGFYLTGTSGTCKRANEFLDDRVSPWDAPRLRPAGVLDDAGHGPTGGDVVIAQEILQHWRSDPEKVRLLNEFRSQGHALDVEKNTHKCKPPVRTRPLSHTVVFFIDHLHAQPHQADILVLLRTCLHPSHGVHLLLTERTAREWADTLRARKLVGQDGRGE